MDVIQWSPGNCLRKCPDSGWDWSRWRTLKVGENYKTGTKDKNPLLFSVLESHCSMNETERMKEAIVCLCHKMSRRSFLTLSEVDTSLVSSSKLVFSLVRTLNPGLWLVRSSLLSRCCLGVDLLTSSHHNPAWFPDNSPAQVTSTGCAEISFLATPVKSL